MASIVLSEHVSLDGVMQSPGNTDVPFEHRGWIFDFDAGPDAERFQVEQAGDAAALLLGRVTYDAMRALWPTTSGELADRLNALPKYVVSTTLTDASWPATVLGEDWRDAVTGLRSELDGDILIYGSRRLARDLFEMGLIDEVRLMVYPLVLGTGDRLFGDMPDKLPLRLVEAQPFGGGVMKMVYAPA